jgi:oligopeptide transport system permease protein
MERLLYFVKRLLGIIPILFIIFTVTFFIQRFAPGSPFSSEKSISPEVMRAIEAKYDLDAPLFDQYIDRFVDTFWHFDFGPSYKREDKTVNELLWESFPKSATLGGLALLFALMLGMSAGVIAGTRQNTPFDYAAMSLSLAGISVPNFVLGPILVMIFSLWLHWFPPARWEGIDTMVMPALCLGVAYAAYIARLTRSGMLEVIRSDFIRTARAKGLSEGTIIGRHALRGGLLPVVTFLGPAVARILTGSLVVEKIFQIPGLGYYFVQSALDRDYNVVVGVVLFEAALLLTLNLLVDIAYTLLDPRVELS